GPTNPTVNTLSGVLTIGNNGITATSSNAGSISQVAGRLDFGATNKNVTVDRILFNGADIAPLQAAFGLQGVVESTGGFTKLGQGVLGMNAQQSYTGATIVSEGTLLIGATNGGSRFSDLTLAAGTKLNL